MSSHAFGLQGIPYYCDEKPRELLQISQYQFGGLRRIYTEQLVYSENLADIVRAQLQLKARRASKKVEEVKKRITELESKEGSHKDELTRELDDLKSLSTQAESIMTAGIEMVSQKPLSRSFTGSEYCEAFSDLLVTEEDMLSDGGVDGQGP